MRPIDQPLWRYNQPGTLRYLVVDELHTFDGAQGSDLACLVRRLKHHISVDSSRFACVGTSATVGDELGQLLEYATSIFDQPFDDSSVIREDRYSSAEFLQGFELRHTRFPQADEMALLSPQHYANPVAYLNAQIPLWFPERDLVLPADLESDDGRRLRIALGELLRGHSMLHVLLQDLQQQGILSEQQCCDSLQVMLASSPEHATLVLQSFVALLAQARLDVLEAPADQQNGWPRVSLDRCGPLCSCVPSFGCGS